MGADLDLFIMKGTPWDLFMKYEAFSFPWLLSLTFGLRNAKLWQAVIGFLCAAFGRVKAKCSKFAQRAGRPARVAWTRLETDPLRIGLLAGRPVQTWGESCETDLGLQTSGDLNPILNRICRLSLCISLKPLLVVMQETAWNQAN